MSSKSEPKKYFAPILKKTFSQTFQMILRKKNSIEKIIFVEKTFNKLFLANCFCIFLESSETYAANEIGEKLNFSSKFFLKKKNVDPVLSRRFFVVFFAARAIKYGTMCTYLLRRIGGTRYSPESLTRLENPRHP